MTATTEGGQGARIRVLVAEDDDLLRSLLREWMRREADVEVIDVAANGHEALEKALQLQPDVLLMDVRMPGMSGLEVLEQLPPEGPRVLILSVEADDASVLAAFRAGARGFLPKRAAERFLLDALRAVANDETWLDRRLTTRLVSELSRLARRVSELERPDAILSAREREVLSAVGRGLTNDQIAKELFVSKNTIKIHVSSILHKLNLPNRTEAALFAVREGLVKPHGNGEEKP
jgi:two-component system, NarL family, response regulator LiaR